MKYYCIRFSILVFLIFFAAAPASIAQEATNTTMAVDTLAQAPPDVTPVMAKNVTVRDNPDDGGGSIRIDWDLSVDDHEGGKITAYRVLRSEAGTDDYVVVGDAPAGKSEFVDNAVTDGIEYLYKVAAINELKRNGEVIWSVMSDSDPIGPVKSSAQWFNMQRINVFVGTVFVCLAIFFFIQKAKSGQDLYIRKIAGLESVDEAVGRATEMGRKILFVPGINDMDNVQTIAGVAILGRVAQLAAEYETQIEVPVSRSLVMITAKEIVKESYSKAGRPDAFNEDQVHYITDDQFGYAAAIDGIIVRDKPATIFYMGAFFAESLIMAETGNSIGAIQIAGTGQPSQLPFFVASCDYTLIGEELFAASAYLSREPRLLGSIKGQDVAKAAILISIIIGVILETFSIYQFSNFFRVIGE
ncbi:MAG: fibronectin type III domain-containing protein [Candidatus Zixiibacteriota bacterium]